jgi:hypothetical protein
VIFSGKFVPRRSSAGLLGCLRQGLTPAPRIPDAVDVAPELCTEE